VTADERDATATDRYRLLVRSIGTADAQVIPHLRPLRRGTDRELAALLYRAPSELLPDVDLETGRRLADALRETGIDVALMPATEPFEPGTGNLEIAMAVKSFDAMPRIIETTMRVLGVDLDSAQRLVCACPAVLVGGVSQATASAMKDRFAPLGVELDVSSPASALYDIAVETADDLARQILADRTFDTVSTSSVIGSGQFFAAGLDAEAAKAVWHDLSRTAAKVRILNRDFQRFDVKLETASVTPAMVEALAAVTGMSEARANRILGSLPIVLQENIRGDQMIELLETTRVAGGVATGVLLPLTSFALTVRPGGDRDSALAWVTAIAGPEAAREFLAPGGLSQGATITGPLTKTQARWLQLELRRCGVAGQLVER
jgi:hypothetical protein